MKLLEFWEEISLMPDAVRQLETLEITEGEYEKLRELFLRDVNLFYEAVKKREDFRLVFLYCFSKMACEVYDRYCEQGISRRVYRDTFYDLTLWCENCYNSNVPGLSSHPAKILPIIQTFAPAAIAFVISPEYLIPPSAITGIPYSFATA